MWKLGLDTNSIAQQQAWQLMPILNNLWHLRALAPWSKDLPEAPYCFLCPRVSLPEFEPDFLWSWCSFSLEPCQWVHIRELEIDPTRTGLGLVLFLTRSFSFFGCRGSHSEDFSATQTQPLGKKCGLKDGWQRNPLFCFLVPFALPFHLWIVIFQEERGKRDLQTE